MDRDPWSMWPAALAAASAIAASLPGALGHALWGDEVASARVLAEPTFAGVLDHVRLTESTPPAWYAIAWVVAFVVEPMEWLRLLSVAFAAAAAALTALWATRVLGDRRLGAVAGMLLALGSAPAAYAEQLRAYALLILLSVVFGLLLVRVGERPTFKAASSLAFVAWAGVMTHYFFVFTATSAAVWLVACRLAPAGRRAAALALAAGSIGFLPWLPSFLDQHGRGRYRWIGGFDLESVLSLPASLFFGPDGALYGIARAVLTAVLVAGALSIARRPGGSAIVALAVLPPAGAAAVWAAGEPVFNERNLLAIAPYLAILAAAGLSRLPRRSLTAVTCLALAGVVTAAAYASATLGRTAYHRIADELIASGWTTDDAVVLDLPRGETSLRFAVGWYLPGHPPLGPGDGERVCSRLFAVGHSSTLGPWLLRHAGRVESVSRFASYDHPVRGRRHGRILVARIRGPIRPAAVTGSAYHLRGRGRACRRAPPADASTKRYRVDGG